MRYNRPRYLEFMSKTKIMDVGFNGPKFTWRGMRNGQMVEVRLDRALMNEKWQSLWPNTLAVIGTCVGSDHCPVVVKCKLHGDERSKRLLRFEAFWTKEGECKDIVEEDWGRHKDGMPIERWNWRINDCRNKLWR